VFVPGPGTHRSKRTRQMRARVWSETGGTLSRMNWSAGISNDSLRTHLPCSQGRFSPAKCIEDVIYRTWSDNTSTRGGYSRYTTGRTKGMSEAAAINSSNLYTSVPIAARERRQVTRWSAVCASLTRCEWRQCAERTSKMCVTPHATRAVAHPHVGRCKMRRVVGARRPNLVRL